MTWAEGLGLSTALNGMTIRHKANEGSRSVLGKSK